MYHIDSDLSDWLCKRVKSAEEIRSFLQMEKRFPGFVFDDYLFSPFGYSVNGIKDSCYMTIHITPQESNSYISFETNADIYKELDRPLELMLEKFSPGSFDIIRFNGESVSVEDSYGLVSNVREQLGCGYYVEFSSFARQVRKAQRAVKIDC